MLQWLITKVRLPLWELLGKWAIFPFVFVSETLVKASSSTLLAKPSSLSCVTHCNSFLTTLPKSIPSFSLVYRLRTHSLFVPWETPMGLLSLWRRFNSNMPMRLNDLTPLSLLSPHLHLILSDFAPSRVSLQLHTHMLFPFLWISAHAILSASKVFFLSFTLITVFPMWLLHGSIFWLSSQNINDPFQTLYRRLTSTGFTIYSRLLTPHKLSKLCMRCVPVL